MQANSADRSASYTAARGYVTLRWDRVETGGGAVVYQVLRGPDTYFETQDKGEALTLFDDLPMWGFRGRVIPETAQQLRESYVGPPLGLREVRSTMIVRACGSAMRVNSPRPAAIELDDDLALLIQQVSDCSRLKEITFSLAQTIDDCRACIDSVRVTCLG